MKLVSDIIQTALSYTGAPGLILCIAIAAVFMAAIRAAVLLLRLVRYVLGFVTFGSISTFVSVALAIGGTLYIIREPAADFLQRFETPVYLGQFDSIPPDAVAGVFEREIMRINPPGVAAVTIQRTRQLADTLHIPAWWIYSTALPECGLNPFTIRKDGIAAGWIQFTTVGLKSHGVALETVKQWCRNGDITAMMNLTDRYMLCAAGGKSLTRPVDAYLCVFCPSAVGKPTDFVLYEGWNNPSYYLNAGLDGYQVQDGRVVRKNAWKDGRITVGELALCLEYKKAKLLQN